MSEKRYGRIAPSVAEITARRNTNLGWDRALAEMIDNSLDAGAQNIRIKIEGRVIEVQDDGRGIVDLLAAATSGRHVRSETTELGMYGVGLKDAWYWAGPRMEIESVHKGLRGSLVADFREIQSRGDWEIEMPEYVPTRDKSGTKIRLFLSDDSPRRSAPTERHFDQLAWVFSPAILDGKSIFVPAKNTARRLKPVLLPTFIESVKDEFEIDGKRVAIDIGVTEKREVLDGEGPIWIQFGHRYIDRSFIGCGEFAANRVRGVVRLINPEDKQGPKWNLSKNKDSLTDNKDELAAAIHIRIKPLLEFSDALSTNSDMMDLAKEIQTEIQSLVVGHKRNAKEGRGSGDGSKGSGKGATPKATGRKRKNAAQFDLEEEGSVEVPVADGVLDTLVKCKLPFHFTDFASEETVGKFTKDGGIRLNSKNKVVAKLCADKNRDGLYALVVAVISHNIITKDGKQRFLFARDDFEQTVGKGLLSLILGEKP